MRKLSHKENMELKVLRLVTGKPGTWVLTSSPGVTQCSNTDTNRLLLIIRSLLYFPLKGKTDARESLLGKASPCCAQSHPSSLLPSAAAATLALTHSPLPTTFVDNCPPSPSTGSHWKCLNKMLSEYKSSDLCFRPQSSMQLFPR